MPYKCWVLVIYFLLIIYVFNYYSCTFSGLSLLGFTAAEVLIISGAGVLGIKKKMYSRTRNYESGQN